MLRKSNWLRAIAWHPNTNQLAICQRNDYIRVYDAADKAPITLRHPTQNNVSILRFLFVVFSVEIAFNLVQEQTALQRRQCCTESKQRITILNIASIQFKLVFRYENLPNTSRKISLSFSFFYEAVFFITNYSNLLILQFYTYMLIFMIVRRPFTKSRLAVAAETCVLVWNLDPNTLTNR